MPVHKTQVFLCIYSFMLILSNFHKKLKTAFFQHIAFKEVRIITVFANKSNF